MGDFFHTSVFSGPEIIAHQRAYALNDPIGSQIDEGLQLIISAQDQDIFFRKVCQYSV